MSFRIVQQISHGNFITRSTVVAWS